MPTDNRGLSPCGNRAAYNRKESVVEDSITYVGMDTHKKQHKVALIYPGEDAIIEFSIKNTVVEIRKMVRKIKRTAPDEVKFCYEAGVCGFTLQRRIEAQGCKCAVIAPSLVPVKPGQRVKTDRRDARKLLAMFKASLLTEVHPPDEKQESARDLTRLRQAAKENLDRVRHHILKFLTRYGYAYVGTFWTLKHINWLGTLEFAEPLLRDVFDNYYTEMQHCMQRLKNIDKQLDQLAESNDYKEMVGLLRCFRGIDTLTAISIITEIFDFGRFSCAREFMSYLGLTPSEDSSGEKQRKGSITKSGNQRVRRLLVEAAWHSRHSYNVGHKLKKRREGQPPWAINIADQAGIRLRKKYYRLISQGKIPSIATVAIAREFAGFIWFMMTERQARKVRQVA